MGDERERGGGWSRESLVVRKQKWGVTQRQIERGGRGGGGGGRWMQRQRQTDRQKQKQGQTDRHKDRQT